jgi:hypothetical protein
LFSVTFPTEKRKHTYLGCRPKKGKNPDKSGLRQKLPFHIQYVSEGVSFPLHSNREISFPNFLYEDGKNTPPRANDVLSLWESKGKKRRKVQSPKPIRGAEQKLKPFTGLTFPLSPLLLGSKGLVGKKPLGGGSMV